MSKEFEDSEKRFLFIRSQILSFEEYMEDGPQKSQLIKSLITWAFKEFANVEGYKSDTRMLILWKLLVYNVLLGPLIEKYFDYNEGKTLDVIKIFGDGKEDVFRSDLTLFQNKEGGGTLSMTSEMELVNVINTTTTKEVISTNKEEQKPINNEKKKVKNFKLMEFHLSPKKEGVQSEVPTEEYSFYKEVTSSKTTTTTTATTCCDVKNNEKNRRISYYPEFNEMTIAGSHGKFSSDMFTSTPRRSVMPNNFEPKLKEEEKEEEVSIYEELKEGKKKEEFETKILQQKQITPGRKFLDKNIEMSLFDSNQMEKDE
ncbi:hypothetical protein Mgra_00004899 [Meloidogyne graminicola]|uniref:Uncharacterized protein n=1 Tax=Meloidogyne graminicola TaxID=189291 RepID=A0A8S9ZQV2_9BILA|nr:hypothetical protein Mgra_00004899 [Meloidogyne graminicola]